MEKLTEKNKGITMVSLVVTIIILLILATVSINIFFTDNGLFERTNKSKKEYEIGQIAEKLELEKEPVFIDNKGKITIEEYIKHIIKEGIIEEKDIEETEEEIKKYITVEDKYVFLVEEEEDGNIRITYEGEINKLKPLLKIEIINITTNSITVKANGKRMEKGEYEYYIKDANSEEEYELKEKQKEEEYVFEKLIQNKGYKIKVIAKNPYGRAEIESAVITTTILEDITSENITLIYNPETWTNESITVNANANIPKGYHIETSKDLLNWEESTYQTYTENGMIYVRLYDGINGTNYIVGDITKIDKVKPVIEKVEPSIYSITISASDNESGIIGYQITTTQAAPNSFINISNTKKLNKTIESLTPGTNYYVWVKDEAGNISPYAQTKTEAKPTLSLSSTSGKTLSGNSVKVTISGTNYGTLTCSTSNSSIATASISGTILTIIGRNSSGTQSATITLTGSKGVSCKYTITSHVHSGSINGGGCYTKAYTVSEACGNTTFTTNSEQIRCNLTCTVYSSAVSAYICPADHGSAAGNYGKWCGQVIGTKYTYTCKNCNQTYSSSTSRCTKVINKTRYSINCGY